MIRTTPSTREMLMGKAVHAQAASAIGKTVFAQQGSVMGKAAGHASETMDLSSDLASELACSPLTNAHVRVSADGFSACSEAAGSRQAVIGAPALTKGVHRFAFVIAGAGHGLVRADEKTS
jgi:hypothetical protein